MIFYKHSETEQLHVYEIRNRWTMRGALLAIVLPLILATVFRGGNNLLAGSLILIAMIITSIIFIDQIPMIIRIWIAKFMGKTVSTAGNMAGGIFRMEIQK